MKVLDTNFVIDLLSGNAAAAAKARLDESPGLSLGVPAPCVAELFRGVDRSGGRGREALESLLAEVEILPLDEQGARIAGRLAAESASRGREVPMMDCLVAGIALLHEATIVSRDRDFGRIPGLSLETY